MQLNIILLLRAFLRFSKGEAKDSALVFFTVVLSVGLLVEKHVKAFVTVLHAPAHRSLPQLALIEHD